MKKILVGVAFVFALVSLALISSCDPAPAPTAEELFVQKIAGTWTLSEVTLDNVVIENAFDGFTLTIKDDKSFTTTNGNAPIWPSKGVFTLKSTTSTEIFDLLRDDNVSITVDMPSENSLNLDFHYIAGGRMASVSGNYSFELKR